VLGNALKGISEAFSALANIGADLPPAVRAKAKKIVIAAIIVTQVATTAAGIASASAGRASGIRRRIK
jgi:hypothetical protein